MELFWILLFYVVHPYAQGQGVYAPANAQIVHSGQACVVKEDNISERIYTIREGDTLVLQCLVKGHPRPQVRWTKTAGSASEKFQETSVFNVTLRIERIQRVQGGRYYCKAENGVGVAAIKSIRVDVQYLDKPVLTVHQTLSDVRGTYYQEKTVFLRCTVNSNPPVRFIWKRGNQLIEQSKDNGVDIYEPLYTQGETKVLKLKNLRPQDFANYTCEVSVRKVCDIPDSSVTFLLTTATSPPALRLSVNETLVVDPGRDVTLSCEVTAGNPTPTVSWSRYPGPMPPRAQIRGGSLSLRSVTPADSGYYNCTAVNSVGNPAKRTVNLIVRVMRNLTFQITPDLNKDSESIQIGRDLKLSCHVDAQPQDKVNYTWYKNAVPVVPSESLLFLRSDPDMAPGTSSLEIVDMKFRDQATYSCVASFPGSSVSELRVDVNITQSSGEVIPPVLTVPTGGGTVTVREGSWAELVCLVDGKPRPPVLWSRADKDLPMPNGDWAMETRDGRLRLNNATRDLAGTYRCQTAQYNGLNIKRREAQVQLIVQYAPLVDPVLQDVRSPSNMPVTLRCTVLKSNPQRVARVSWLVNGRPLRPETLNTQDPPQLRIENLRPGNNGTYECSINNGVGSSSCIFNVSARPYNPEFYYDTPNPIRIQKDNTYSYNLQWTQKEPAAVDRIIGYWINCQSLSGHTVISKQITVSEPKKGELMSYALTDLRIPLSYEVWLTPITMYGQGDSAYRIIQYSEHYVCGFEDDRICGFTQDRSDVFDWTRQNQLSQNPKRSPNTGPDTDRSGTKEGYYMYIEASRPRQPMDTARLLSPLYNVTAKGPKGSNRMSYCISFYYHMRGKHIGSLNVLLRVKSIAMLDTPVWAVSGNQGPQWRLARVPVTPIGPFQVVFEGVRGGGYEGDIAIDDVSVTKGVCKQEKSISNQVLSGGPALQLDALLACLLFCLRLFYR
ncbi:MAM domain-containing glycosylphosphatidylinositol anchor protein 1 [Conger conger]|uniref:MAM domain-containing glycosylphosphatidylinositol anchor protein 1 n=1 Tax=Conger conger TaxID=82655 RepID=UPI002A5ACF4C|nr:MAM domain-containing glycosylphosphatidylinositol anchor protein 1 [Conger conger]